MNTKASKEKMKITTAKNIKSGKTKHSRLGTKHSEETINRYREVRKGIPSHENTKESIKKSISGSKWYNNGTINKRVKSGEEIPEGYVKGRLL